MSIIKKPFIPAFFIPIFLPRLRMTMDLWKLLFSQEGTETNDYSCVSISSEDLAVGMIDIQNFIQSCQFQKVCLVLLHFMKCLSDFHIGKNFVLCRKLRGLRVTFTYLFLNFKDMLIFIYIGITWTLVQMHSCTRVHLLDIPTGTIAILLPGLHQHSGKSSKEASEYTQY